MEICVGFLFCLGLKFCLICYILCFKLLLAYKDLLMLILEGIAIIRGLLYVKMNWMLVKVYINISSHEVEASCSDRVAIVSLKFSLSSSISSSKLLRLCTFNFCGFFFGFVCEANYYFFFIL